MPKEKVALSYRIKHCFTHHPWLKVISLMVAVITWFYIKGEISSFSR